MRITLNFRTLFGAILVTALHSSLAIAAGPACSATFEVFPELNLPRAMPISAKVAPVLAKISALATRLGEGPDFTSPRVWRKESASFGLPGLDLPQSSGGSAWKASDMVQVFEAAGEHALDLRDVVGAAHARPLTISTEPEVQAILSKVVSGDAYVAIAITEPEAGSNMRAMKSTARPTSGGYLLTGQKLYNARLNNATHVVVFTQSVVRAGKLNAFILPIDYPGLHIRTLKAPGLRGNSFGGLTFENLFVPERYRLGGEGEGGRVFSQHFLYWRLMMAAAAVGTGWGAIKQVPDRLRSRQAFGGPIGRFTHLQQPLAEHTAKLHMAELLIGQAARLIDEGHERAAIPLVAMAKAEGVEFALEAADFAMKTFGAEGYSDLRDLGQRVADLMGLRIADGTTDVLRQSVVRHVYGDDLWEMAIELGEQ